MPLAPGTRLGPYELLAPLGAGGMGEVYRARDMRLNRAVAVKVLLEHLSHESHLRERFEREARAASSLNHPNICTLHDVGRHGSADYLVMEYLEGETLAQRLTKGALPLDQVLRYAIEIASALDHAHRHGVVHRDLKPSNIMLTKADAKVLDFGLAKVSAPVTMPGSAETANTLTGKGVILGTLQYMAPEQLEGKEADARTDIFAFGAVVYEMATGRKAFEGQSGASLIGAILHTEPPSVSSRQPLAPPALDRLVRKCLAKDAEKRWQSAGDLHDELEWIKDGGPQGGAAAARPPKRGRTLALYGALVVAAAAAGVLGGWYMKSVPQQPVSRVTISLPAGQRLVALDQPALAISPEGKNLVYVAAQGATQQLFLRPLGELEAKPIAETEGAAAPFFSPDGRWVGFFAEGKLKKVSLNGGVAVTLASAPNPGGATWSSQGTLALQPMAVAAQGLQEVSQDGGALQPLTRVGKGESVHRWPEFLPGGKGMLFAGSASFTAWNQAQIAVQAGSGSEPKTLANGSQPRYAKPGYLLYAQSGTLMAAPFDAGRLALTGAAVPVIEGVMESTATGVAQYSVSSTGTLVYLAGGVAGSLSRLVWVNRKGDEQPVAVPPRSYQFPRISPDGDRVVFGIAEQEMQLWVYSFSRNTTTRLTFEGKVNGTPVWSPDGKRIAFDSNRGGPDNLYSQASDGSVGAERLTKTDYTHAPSSFSPDGRLLAYVEVTPQTGRDIWVLRLADGKALPFLRTPYEETAPRFSPDGRWLAYSSDETGRREIYVQPYPGPGPKWQISADGGQEPVWNPNGRELFYRSGSRMMAVEVETTTGFLPRKPKVLFDGPYLQTSGSFPYYDVSRDGQRFLMLKPVESQASAAQQINVVLNWWEELKEKVPK
jgi:eukaryotic-like serine/threonine-protein kinase